MPWPLSAIVKHGSPCSSSRLILISLVLASYELSVSINVCSDVHIRSALFIYMMPIALPNPPMCACESGPQWLSGRASTCDTGGYYNNNYSLLYIHMRTPLSTPILNIDYAEAWCDVAFITTYNIVLISTNIKSKLLTPIVKNRRDLIKTAKNLNLIKVTFFII